MCLHVWVADRALEAWLKGRAEVRRCAACGEMQVRGPEGSAERKWETLVVGPDLGAVVGGRDGGNVATLN
jgi:hypothetical protein